MLKDKLVDKIVSRFKIIRGIRLSKRGLVWNSLHFTLWLCVLVLYNYHLAVWFKILVYWTFLEKRNLILTSWFINLNYHHPIVISYIKHWSSHTRNTYGKTYIIRFWSIISTMFVWKNIWSNIYNIFYLTMIYSGPSLLMAPLHPSNSIH